MKPKNNNSERNLSLVVLGLVVVVGAFLLGINFITDWLWFDEMGYVSVFFTKLVTQLKFGIPCFVIVTLIGEFYLHRLKRGYFTKIASSENTDMRKLSKFTNLIAAGFGLIVTVFGVSRLWFQILQFVHATDFKVKDPLFGADISFYIFKLEFLQQLNEMVIGLVVLFVAVTVIYYLILLTMHTPDIYDREEPIFEEAAAGEPFNGSGNPFAGAFNGNNPFDKVMKGVFEHRKPKPKKEFNRSNFRQLLDIASHQIVFLGIVFFLMIAGNFFLKQFELLHSHTGALYGAGFTDVVVNLWLYRILMVMAVFGAISVGYFVKKNNFKKLLGIPVAMIIIGLAGSGIAMVVQNFVVSPDEINKEAKYLERNIKYTQMAYDLDKVEVKPFAADNQLTSDDIQSNNETISNIRINDYKPVKTFYNQTQSIRQYYTFNDVDIDRYNVDGKLTQTYMATREIDESKINDTWLNRHLKYTHGYGVTLSRVDTITASGQPDVLIKNIPPESAIADITVKRPEIYFGELSNDYILTNTNEEEFDYPDGNKNKYAQYKGTAGIKMNFFNRLLFAIREGSLKMLVSSNINSDSKIVIYRNIIERVNKIMPYLSYEKDPYAVTANGKVYWILDGYTTSPYYPYSEPYSGVKGSTNYIRNSVKVVIDAYNGNVDFYVVDEDDQIAQTFKKIYPKLFKSVDAMPQELREHVRYPNSLFEIQAGIYTRYHMNDVKVFYQKEDLWDIAHEIYGTDEVKMDPTYFVVKLPGEEKAEFINSLPFTPKSKQNMTALMVARNDGENYGKLLVYQFPKNKTIYGPMQIEAQIDQNTKISQDFSLWSSSGSKYSRGNLFVIPLETSLLYVEPVYLEASNSAIPEVKRVIVAYNDTIAYEATLGEALNSLFGEGAASGYSNSGNAGKKEGGEKNSKGELIEKANKAYEDGQKALKDGDWATYGNKMSELESYLKELAQ